MSRFGFQGGIEVTNEIRLLGQLGNLNIVNHYDVDALAFFVATELNLTTTYFPSTVYQITGQEILDNINVLVLNYKYYSLWNKMFAVYPRVGGTYATQKWNLIDPRDLDIANRLSTFGTITYGPTGANPNGTTGYEDTHFVFNTIYRFNHGVSFFPNENTVNGFDVAASSTPRINLTANWDGINAYNDDLSSVVGRITLNVPSNPPISMFSFNRSSNVLLTSYRDGVSVGTATGTETANLPTDSFFIFARNTAGSANNFSFRESLFNAFHESFNSQESLDFWNSTAYFQYLMHRLPAGKSYTTPHITTANMFDFRFESNVQWFNYVDFNESISLTKRIAV